MRHHALRGTHQSIIEEKKKIQRKPKGKRGRIRGQGLTPAQEKEAWTSQEIGVQDWDAAATANR